MNRVGQMKIVLPFLNILIQTLPFEVVVVVVVFPQAPFRATNVPRPTLVSSNCATAPWLSEECRR